MKVYLFNSNNGLYEGEDFQADDRIGVEEGMTTVPPPTRQPGQIPVYDRNSGSWRLVSMEELRNAGAPYA